MYSYTILEIIFGTVNNDMFCNERYSRLCAIGFKTSLLKFFVGFGPRARLRTKLLI